jgi:hypothetical protein
MGAALASTALSFNQSKEDMKDEIVLEQGSSYHLQGVTAAGSSPLISPGVTWEEIPYTP